MTPNLNPEACVGPAFDRKLYDQNGFFVLKNFLPAALVAEMAKAIPSILTDVVDARRQGGKEIFTFELEKDSTPAIANKVFTCPKLLDLVEQLTGPDIVLYRRRFVIKDAVFTESVPSHHDCAFEFGSLDKVAIFVPFDSTDPASGSIGFIAGTHSLGYLGGTPSVSIDLTDDDLSLFPRFIPTVEPGDIVIYDYRTFHFSRPSTTGKRRLVMQLVYQPATDGSGWASELVRGSWQTDIIYTRILPRRIQTSTVKTENTIRFLYVENQKLQAEINELKSALPPSDR